MLKRLKRHLLDTLAKSLQNIFANYYPSAENASFFYLQGQNLHFCGKKTVSDSDYSRYNYIHKINFPNFQWMILPIVGETIGAFHKNVSLFVGVMIYLQKLP